MPLLRIRDFIDEVFNVHFQGYGLRHDLVSKAGILLLKQSYDNERQLPVRHDRVGDSAEIKVRLAPTTVCRRTALHYSLKYTLFFVFP